MTEISWLIENIYFVINCNFLFEKFKDIIQLIHVYLQVMLGLSEIKCI
jgi:hypothetical protein